MELGDLGLGELVFRRVVVWARCCLGELKMGESLRLSRL